jgi:hypothetical protein
MSSQTWEIGPTEQHPPTVVPGGEKGGLKRKVAIDSNFPSHSRQRESHWTFTTLSKLINFLLGDYRQVYAEKFSS